MMKTIEILFLCFVLLFMASCGNDDEPLPDGQLTITLDNEEFIFNQLEANSNLVVEYDVFSIFESLRVVHSEVDDHFGISLFGPAIEETKYNFVPDATEEQSGAVISLQRLDKNIIYNTNDNTSGSLNLTTFNKTDKKMSGVFSGQIQKLSVDPDTGNTTFISTVQIQGSFEGLIYSD